DRGPLMAAEISFDMAAYVAGLDAQVEEFRQASCQGLGALGHQVAERARQLARVLDAPRHGRNPGDLQRAIGSTGLMTGPKGWYVEGGGNVGDAEGFVDYGFYEEYGSVHNAPHPFLRPAIAEAGGWKSATLLTSGRHRAARARRLQKRAAVQIGTALMGKQAAKSLAQQRRAPLSGGPAPR